MDDDQSPTITESDLTNLNQRAVLRSTRLVRQGAEVALVVALVLAIAWLWQLVRYQQLITDNYGDEGFGGGFGRVGFTDIPWTQRVDAVAGSLSILGYAVLVGGLGLGLRMYGEVTALRHGGNITPWELGDEIEDADADESSA